MEYRYLGRSALKVSPLCLGAMMFGGETDEATAKRIIDKAAEQGVNFLDSADVYHAGRSEQIVGRAIAAQRDHWVLATKFGYVGGEGPNQQGQSRKWIMQSVEASLKRLGSDYLDLYLLHWRGAAPLAETVGEFEKLRAAGKILRWGVSNLDVADLEELSALAGGEQCATDQVLYNLQARGICFDLLGWCRRRGMPIMAYSPLGQGGSLLAAPALVRIAARHRASPAQVALAWVLRQPDVIAIPKAGNAAHVRENAAARELALTAEDMAELDRALPPPRRKQPLGML
jgi:aryl-alcohol dehydrogenase-like predicted oxidoreductase